MKSLKIWGNIFFVVSIAPLLIGFMVSCMVGEVDMFGVAGMLHYTWIMWLFTPISIVSLIVGICLKNRKEKYKKNIVAASIVLTLLIIFGSFGFIFSSSVSYDVTVLKTIEQQTEWTFPNNVEIATLIEKDYRLSYVKIADDADNIAFEENIKSSGKWTDSLPDAIGGMLPFKAAIQTQDCKYLMFYNRTAKQYNAAPTASGVYDCVYMAYDENVGRIIILYDCTLQFTA